MLSEKRGAKITLTAWIILIFTMTMTIQVQARSYFYLLDPDNPRDFKAGIMMARLHHHLSDWHINQIFLKLPDARTFRSWVKENVATKYGNSILEVETSHSLKLTDPQLLSIPLLIMTGHDKEHAKMPLMSGKKKIEVLQEHLLKAEQEALRKYILEIGGTIFFDDAGPTNKFTQRFEKELKIIFPEYKIIEIPENHELYRAYFLMQHPPMGWKIVSQPEVVALEPLKGLVVNGRLAIILSQNQYLPLMQTYFSISQHISYAVWKELSEEVYKLMTNVIVYTLRNGGAIEHHRQ